jgi:hypothetical protein
MLHELLNGYTVEKLWGLQTQEQFSDYPENSEVKVSNFGRVMYKGKILPQTEDKNGYLVVDIPGEKDQPHVHTMVVKTFLKKDNPDPQTYNIVHHISGNIYDNRAENLLYVTCEQHTLIHHGSIKICFSNKEKDNCKRWRDKCAFDNEVRESESHDPEWIRMQRQASLRQN